MEVELDRARDELASQKAALEKAWSEEKDLKVSLDDFHKENKLAIHQSEYIIQIMSSCMNTAYDHRDDDGARHSIT